MDTINSDMIDEFKKGKLWIHIDKIDRDLVKDLADALNVKFASGDDLDSHCMDTALYDGEAWFRYDNQRILPNDNCCRVSFVREYPRTSTCRPLAPWLYEHGSIVDIKTILNIQDIHQICEDDIMSLLGTE